MVQTTKILFISIKLIVSRNSDFLTCAKNRVVFQHNNYDIAQNPLVITVYI